MIAAPDKIRVLVVEDSPTVRQLLVHILNADPQLQVVATAADGEQAIEMTKLHRPHVITMDIHMPRMDGYELTRALRNNDTPGPSPHIPIIAVTANAMRGEEERCLAAGMDAYLAKPVSLDRLRAVLYLDLVEDVRDVVAHRLLRQRKARRDLGVVQSLRNELEDFALARGELGEGARGALRGRIERA